MERLTSAIKEMGIAPVLFVGSGLSIRYIDAPNWDGLLSEIAGSITLPRSYEHYRQLHDQSKEALAEELSELYFDQVPDNDLVDGQVRSYYFKAAVAKLLNARLQASLPSLDESPEVRALRRIRPSAVITTNYDELMERLFPEYKVVVSEDSVLSEELSAVGEIYKIHGSAADPSSIVITQADYDKFDKRQMYLTAKLLTLFLEYPIIFLGYSLQDRNVQKILNTVVSMTPPEKLDNLRQRIWFIRHAETNDLEQRYERIPLPNGLYIDLPSYALNDLTLVYESLATVGAKQLPVKFLRYLKANVYKLTAQQVHNPRLLNVNVVDIERIEDFDSLRGRLPCGFAPGEESAPFWRTGYRCRAGSRRGGAALPCWARPVAPTRARVPAARPRCVHAAA